MTTFQVFSLSLTCFSAIFIAITQFYLLNANINRFMYTPKYASAALKSIITPMFVTWQVSSTIIAVFAALWLKGYIGHSDFEYKVTLSIIHSTATLIWLVGILQDFERTQSFQPYRHIKFFYGYTFIHYMVVILF